MSFQWVKNPDDVHMGFFYDNVLLLEISNENYNKSHVGTNAGEKAIKNYIGTLTELNVVQKGNIRLLKDIEQQNLIERLFFESAASAASAAAPSVSHILPNPLAFSNSNNNDNNLLEQFSQAAEQSQANAEQSQANAETAAAQAENAETAAAQAETAEEAQAAARDAQAAQTEVAKPSEAKKGRIQREPSERIKILREKAENAKAKAEKAKAEAEKAKAIATENVAKVVEEIRKVQEVKKIEGTLKSSQTIEQFLQNIKELIPNVLKIPKWAEELSADIKNAIQLAIIYNYVDQVHDIKRAEIFKDSRVRAVLKYVLKYLPESFESSIERTLFEKFNEALSSQRIDPSINIFTKDSENIKKLKKELKENKYLLRFQDGGGLAAKVFPISLLPQCSTLTGKYDPCLAESSEVSTAQTIQFDDVEHKFKIKYQCLKDGEKHITKRQIIINGFEPIDCESLFDNVTICAASAGVSAAIHGLERYHTLYNKQIYTNSSPDNDDNLVKLIACHMFICKHGKPDSNQLPIYASMIPGSGPHTKVEPTNSMERFQYEINRCNIDDDRYKKLVPIAKIVLALTRQSLKDYSGDIEDFKHGVNPIRWNLMAAIGRLKSYADIHYLSEALIRCKLENKELFMTSVDKGVAGLTRHYASLMGIKATIVVQLGVSTKHELHVFKFNPVDKAPALTLEQCCKALNIIELIGFPTNQGVATNILIPADAIPVPPPHIITNKRADEYRKYENEKNAKKGSSTPKNEPDIVEAILEEERDINEQFAAAVELDNCDIAIAKASTPANNNGTTGAGDGGRRQRTQKHRTRKTRKRNRKQRKTRKV